MHNVIIGGVLLFLGSYFFIMGLDENKDYLRLNHACWHIFGTGFAYYILKAADVKIINKRGYCKIEEEDT